MRGESQDLDRHVNNCGRGVHCLLATEENDKTPREASIAFSPPELSIMLHQRESIARSVKMVE